MFQRFKRFATVATLLSLLAFFSPTIASAASLTAISDTVSRLKASTASDHTIKYTTPTGVAAGQTMTLVFPSGFTIGTVDNTDIDVSWGPSTGAENELTLAATPTGATWGAAFSSQTLTVTSGSGAITAASKVIIEIGTNATAGTTGDQQITNHATPATYTVSLTVGPSDSGKLAIVVLSNDQFTVSATVDPTITFSIDNTSTAFGTLSSSSPTTADTTIIATISTNAQSGYSVKISDTGGGGNPGLWNTAASVLIASASNDLSSVAGYGIQASQTGGATIALPYTASGTSVGGYQLLPQDLATYTGPASGHTVSIVSKARASGSTPAGAYADTVTLIATGNF